LNTEGETEKSCAYRLKEHEKGKELNG